MVCWRVVFVVDWVQQIGFKFSIGFEVADLSLMDLSSGSLACRFGNLQVLSADVVFVALMALSALVLPV